MKRLALALSVGLAAFACGPPSHAAAIFSFQNVGPDVVGTLSGSLDLTGSTVTPNFGSNTPPAVHGDEGIVATGPSGSLQTEYTSISGPRTFGPGGGVLATSATGDAIFLYSDQALFLPAAYVSGAVLNASLTFQNATLNSLGLTFGTYIYTLISGDTLTLALGTVPVPEPRSLVLLSLCIGLAAPVAAMQHRPTSPSLRQR